MNDSVLGVVVVLYASSPDTGFRALGRFKVLGHADLCTLFRVKAFRCQFLDLESQVFEIRILIFNSPRLLTIARGALGLSIVAYISDTVQVPTVNGSGFRV